MNMVETIEREDTQPTQREHKLEGEAPINHSKIVQRLLPLPMGHFGHPKIV